MNHDHPLAGSRLAGYRVGELLGRGGMGEVYRADDVRLGRTVALKVLAPGLGTADGMLRESRLAAGLDHPNVIPIFEAGDDEGRLFIAMRYVAGGDLRALLRREGKLAPARAIAIAAQVADALDAAHRRGLVHRDVKPSNVLLDDADGREHCYLADFGLTQRAAEADPADGHLVGTVAYVAPEQIRGDAIDGRADQYALAGLLFECLTGTAPFDGRSDVAVIFAHLEEPAPPASGRDPSLPAAVDAVLARGMAKDPGERFASCTELVRAAGTALGVDGSAARPRRLRRLLAGRARGRRAGRGGDRRARRRRDRAARRDGRHRADRPRLEPRGFEHAGGRPSRRARGHARRRSGWPTSATASCGATSRGPAARADDLQRRAARPRRARRQGLRRADGRFLNGIVSRYDAVSGVREDGIELLACAMASGEGVVWAAGCPSVQRLSTGDGRLRKLADGLPPVPAAGDASRTARAVPRAGRGRRLGVGAGRRARPAHVAARRAHGRPAGGARSRIPADLGGRRGRARVDHRRLSATASCPSTSNAAWPCRRCRSAAVPRGSPPARAACGWPTRSMAPCRVWIRGRAAWWRRSTWAGAPRGIAVGAARSG